MPAHESVAGNNKRQCYSGEVQSGMSDDFKVCFVEVEYLVSGASLAIPRINSRCRMPIHQKLVAYSKVDLFQHGDFSGWKAQFGFGSFHLIQNPQDYFDAEPTFKQSYASQSGEIFGILKQMKES